MKKDEKRIKRFGIISALIGLIVGIIIILKFNNWFEAFFIGITISLITGFILERMIKVNSNDT